MPARLAALTLPGSVKRAVSRDGHGRQTAATFLLKIHSGLVADDRVVAASERKSVISIPRAKASTTAVKVGGLPWEPHKTRRNAI